MKSAIVGFNQRDAVAAGLNAHDLIFLDWFMYFYWSGKMTFKQDPDGYLPYGWANREYIIEQLPILGFTNADSVTRMIRKLKTAGFIEACTAANDKQRGTRGFYRPTPKVFDLMQESNQQTKMSATNFQQTQMSGGHSDQQTQMRAGQARPADQNVCSDTPSVLDTPSKEDTPSSPPGPISEESSTSFDVQSSSEDIPDPHSGGDIPSLFPENEPTNTPETNHQIILDSWNQLAKHHNVTPASKLTAARKSHINARLKDRDWRNSWREAMKQIPDCPFLVGDNDKGWRADLEWFLRPDSVTKILEGKYTRSKAQPEEEISDSLKEILGDKRGKR